jgi:hypothetical protein
MNTDTYFGSKKVTDTVLTTIGQVGLTFDDGTTEVMHKDEWEAGKDDKPMEDRQKVFVEGTLGLRKSILDEMKAHNLRVDELGLVMDWTMESFNRAKGAFVSAVYGVKDWVDEATVQHCFKAKGGNAWDTGDLNPNEQSVVMLMRDVKLKDVPRVLQRIGQGIQELQKQALESAMGKPMNEWRMDDLEKYAEEHPYVSDTEVGTVVEGDGDGPRGETPGGDSAGGDQGKADAEPAPQA